MNWYKTTNLGLIIKIDPWLIKVNCSLYCFDKVSTIELRLLKLHDYNL